MVSFKILNLKKVKRHYELGEKLRDYLFWSNESSFIANRTLFTVLELSNLPENGYYWAFTTPNLDY